MSLKDQYKLSKRKVKTTLSAAENEMAKFEANTELSKRLLYITIGARENIMKVLQQKMNEADKEVNFIIYIVDR